MKLKLWRHQQSIQIFDARSYDDAKKVHLRMLDHLQAGHDKLHLPGKTHAWINNIVEGQWSVIVDLNADKIADMNRLLTHVINGLGMLANIFYINPSWPYYFDQTKTMERPDPRPIALFITKNEQKIYSVTQKHMWHYTKVCIFVLTRTPSFMSFPLILSDRIGANGPFISILFREA